MFIGEYHHSIDEKGRLAVPVKFRSRLKKGAVVTRGLDQCLFLFEAGEWNAFAKRVAALPLSKSDDRAFSRFMLAGAMEVEIDSQGRVVLPEYLREYAVLAKETVVAGLFNRIEIWDKALWDKYR